MGAGGAGGLGVGGLLLVMVISWVTGVNPMALLSMANGVSSVTSGPAEAGRQGAPEGDPQAEFVAVVLADTEDTFAQLFAKGGDRYQPPTLVLFSDAVNSACGLTDAAVGPFYCPGDRKVYIDLSFFRELDQKFGAPGDFAQAYVVAHEVGHHLQSLLGVAEQVGQLRQRASQAQANQLSVRQELQADCFAGVWGHYAAQKQLLDAGDVEEGLRAAAAIGDDTLQRRGQGRVSPETWTHGSSEQRVEWLNRGLKAGSLEACDTFGETR
jgi:predicted metalloprotease